jgi:hypothetical protein
MWLHMSRTKKRKHPHLVVALRRQGRVSSVGPQQVTCRCRLTCKLNVTRETVAADTARLQSLWTSRLVLYTVCSGSTFLQTGPAS